MRATLGTLAVWRATRWRGFGVGRYCAAELSRERPTRMGFGSEVKK